MESRRCRFDIEIGLGSAIAKAFSRHTLPLAALLAALFVSASCGGGPSSVTLTGACKVTLIYTGCQEEGFVQACERNTTGTATTEMTITQSGAALSATDGYLSPYTGTEAGRSVNLVRTIQSSDPATSDDGIVPGTTTVTDKYVLTESGDTLDGTFVGTQVSTNTDGAVVVKVTTSASSHWVRLP